MSYFLFKELIARRQFRDTFFYNEWKYYNYCYRDYSVLSISLFICTCNSSSFVDSWIKMKRIYLKNIPRSIRDKTGSSGNKMSSANLANSVKSRYFIGRLDKSESAIAESWQGHVRIVRKSCQRKMLRSETPNG